MAYNILKGTVEFTGDNGSLENTVDLATDQSIAGGKTFAQKLTASAISLGGSNLVHPALTAISGDGAGRLIVSDGDGTATCDATLTFLNSSLTASYFSGSGQGLTNLQVTELSGTIQATQISLGNGVENSGGKLVVKPHDGIAVDSDGVAILLNSTGGLGFNHDQGLLVDPAAATIITDSGQNLADADLLLVQDITHGLRKTTLTNLYSNYIAGKLPSSIGFNGSTANGILTYGNASTADVESNLTFDGSIFTVTGDSGLTGSVTIDKNHSDINAATVTGIEIDFDKTGASVSNNTMYGLNIDMDNTTATNGNNTMYGLHVTPTLTHAANAGVPVVYGALFNAQGGTNGTSIVQAARFEAGGGDLNYGIQLDVEDGGVDLRIESSADSGDYFQIQTTTAGASTITTVDDGGAAAHLTFNVDGDIVLNPVGGTVVVDGSISGSGNISGSFFYGDGSKLSGIAAGISFNGSTANGLLTYGNASTADVESQLTFDGSTLIVESAVNPVIYVSNTAANVAGAVTILENTRGGGAGQADDFCGGIEFKAPDSATNNTQYGKISTSIASPTNGSEAGYTTFEVTTGGTTATTYLTLDGVRSAITASMDISASNNISASAFYGDGSKLTGIAGGTPATASGGTGEIQFARTVDGEFSSDGALVFNTGSVGAQGTYLTSSNVVVQYTTHMSGAVHKHYKYKEANYNLTGSDHIVLFLGAGATLTASLPNLNIDLNGIEYVVKNLGTDDVYVTASALTQQFIDGSGSLTIHQGDSLKLLAFYGGGGYEWAIIDYYNV